MNKIVAAAVAAAFIAPLAMADVDLGPVKIYGSLRSAVEVINVTPVAGTTVQDGQDSQTRLMDQTSKFGVKGDWKINDNIKAIGQLEARIYLGNSGDPLDGSKIGFGTRNTFIGLSGEKFGTVRLGRYDNQYKLIKKNALGAFDDIMNDASDPTNASNTILGRMGGREGDSVSYETPRLAGFAGGLSYNFGKVDSTNATASYKTTCVTVSNCTTTAVSSGDKINAPQFSALLNYQSQYFDAGVAYTKLSDAYYDLTGSKLSAKKELTGKTGGESADALSIGATGKFAGLHLSAVWERTNSNANGVGLALDQEQDSYGIQALYNWGDFDFQAGFAKAGDVKNNLKGVDVANTGAKQYNAGVSYKVHKQVRVIATYTKVDNESAATFASASGFATAKGADVGTFAIGLRGDF
ncbi:porin [Chitinibacter bivalviorum]|uniref:Porin n=1 Tax=Chitinibacter bivalviorum TaxID=2739434 RepID=A0A7H9BE61_9NEIS|nr:porin [Chitinibacter bivalviorum]QLG86817.1 porin [Chitinibacter bivalviorum]